MTQNLVALSLFILFPAFIIWLSAKISLLKKLGLVLICYLSGIIVGNVGILPSGFTAYQLNIQDISVAIALPMLLFSLDVKRWLKLSRASLISMLLAIVAITITVFILQFTLLSGVDKGWQLGGMATALYTGGTPNVAAIKAALQVDNETYILFNTYDTVISLIYIFFMVSVARAFFQKVFGLKPYQHLGNFVEAKATDISDESIEAYGKLLEPTVIKGLLKAFLLSAAILALAFVVGELFPADSGTAITIFLITTLGIAASFIKAVRSIKYTFQLGMYIIYIFCFTVASMTKFDVLIHINWTIFLHVTFAIVGSMFIHGLLCKIFKIDADTMIITSVSAVCSPPFVPVVASALKNRDILIGGLITGIIGYAIGNYLGIGIAMLFKMMA